jgi:hypothetical protein
MAYTEIYYSMPTLWIAIKIHFLNNKNVLQKYLKDKNKND